VVKEVVVRGRVVRGEIGVGRNSRDGRDSRGRGSRDSSIHEVVGSR
jgi:hypothetical protein